MERIIANKKLMPLFALICAFLWGCGFSVTKTAEMTGYADVFNFSKMYRKHFGESPSGRSRQKD